MLNLIVFKINKTCNHIIQTVQYQTNNKTLPMHITITSQFKNENQNM